MGGLIVAVGIDDAEATVRRAAPPLLRRPRHRLLIAPGTPSDVSLAFAGARGGVFVDEPTGVVAVLDGELFTDGGPLTGDAAACVLVGAWLSGTGDTFEPPEGQFAACVWDGRSETATIVTDRYGRRRVYVARVRGGTLAAGELKALVAGGVTPELDPQAWAELLAYEHALGDATPLAGVDAVPAAATLAVRRSGVGRPVVHWRYRLEPASDGDEDDLVEELGRRLRRAVERRVDDTTGLALSGGLDSRSLASVLARVAPGTVALTFGAPGSRDLELGSELAQRAGLRHRVVPLTPGFIARGAAETVWLSEGHVRCFHVHHLALRLLAEEHGLGSVLIGYGGDHLMRVMGRPVVDGPDLAGRFHRWRAKCVDDELLEQVLTASFASQLRGRARAGLARQLDGEAGEPVARVRQVIYNAQRWKIWPGAELFADDLAPRDPFDDHALVDFCRRMPESLRADGRLERAYLRRFPALAGVPNTADWVPPAATGLRFRAARAAERARRIAWTRLDATLGPGWRAAHTGIGDYAADLRAGSGSLLGMLLEPRTLARGQLREDGVRSLVDATLSGRGRHTRALGMLLGLELFQRQFVDGDGFAGGAPGTSSALEKEVIAR